MSISNQKNEATSMKTLIKSFARKALHDQRGQVLPWVALATVGMLGVGGLGIDVGRAYVAQAQLQNYANAAALCSRGVGVQHVFDQQRDHGSELVQRIRQR